MAVTRTSQHFDDARSKLAEVQVALKSEAAEIKRWEDYTPGPGESPGQVEEALRRAKADLEAPTTLCSKRQATTDEAEQQLRTEQERLNRLETELDELVKNADNFKTPWVAPCPADLASHLRNRTCMGRLPGPPRSRGSISGWNDYPNAAEHQ